MSDDQKKAPQGLQATITAGLGTLATASCLKWIDPKDAQYWVVVANIVVPVIGYFLAKWFCAINEPEGLTQYKARLDKDLASQKKVLEDKYTSEDLKREIQKKYDETMLKMVTANQNYTKDGLVIET